MSTTVGEDMVWHAIEISRSTHNPNWTRLYQQWIIESRNTSQLFLDWLKIQLPIVDAAYNGNCIVLYFENREIWLEFSLKMLS